MFRVSKRWVFSAAHSLESLPVDHPCHRMHGHNYSVEVVFSSDELDSHGMVLDYREMKPIGEFIAEYLDHRNLNHAVPGPTTVESMARWLHSQLSHRFSVCVDSVRVSEGDGTWGEYRQ